MGLDTTLPGGIHSFVEGAKWQGEEKEEQEGGDPGRKSGKWEYRISEFNWHEELLFLTSPSPEPVKQVRSESDTPLTQTDWHAFNTLLHYHGNVDLSQLTAHGMLRSIGDGYGAIWWAVVETGDQVLAVTVVWPPSSLPDGQRNI